MVGVCDGGVCWGSVMGECGKGVWWGSVKY